MQFLTLAVLAALSSQFTSVLSLPVSEFNELEQRDNPAPGAGTLASPRILTIDCTSVGEVCNAQCAAILCFGAPAVMFVPSCSISLSTLTNMELGNTVLVRLPAQRSVPRVVQVPALSKLH